MKIKAPEGGMEGTEIKQNKHPMMQYNMDSIFEVLKVIELEN